MADLTSTLAMVKELENAHNFVRIACNMNLACFVVICYDWITTLGPEIEFIWKAKQSKLTVSYILTRYLTLAYCPTILYYQFANSLSKSACTKLYHAMTTDHSRSLSFEVSVMMIPAATLCVAMILTVRMVAIWEQRRCITCVVHGLYAVATVFVLLFSLLSLKRTGYLKSLGIGSSIGCIQTFQSLILAIIFIAGSVFDTGNLALLHTRGTSLLWWGRHARLSRMVHADGILLYVYMSGISIANVIFVFSSSDYQPLLLMIPAVFRSLLACRVVLHLRMQPDGLPMMSLSENTSISQRSKVTVIDFQAVKYAVF